MMHPRHRRSAVVLVSLLALVGTPLTQRVSAGAAVADSKVSITDPANDTREDSGDPNVEDAVVANRPYADIRQAFVRFQNGNITFSEFLEAYIDLLEHNYLYWVMGPPGFTAQSAGPRSASASGGQFWVQLKKGANGLGEVAVYTGDPTKSALTPIKCEGTGAGIDLVAHSYTASLPASCVGSPSSFAWAAWSQMQPPDNPSGKFVWDAAPDYPASAKAVTPATVTGYWAGGSDGKVYNFGDAPAMGSPQAATPTVDVEASRFGKGYWTLDEKGVVSAFGPVLYGSLAPADLKAGEKATSLSGTPTGSGYWVFTNKGRVFAFGDAAKSIGDVSTLKLNGDILDSAATPSGKGYYMVGSDGGVFSLGDANFEGSMGGKPLNGPVQSIVPDPDGQGYWLVANDGGIFSFKALFHGSMGDKKLNKPMTGMVPYGDAYLMVAEDGGVFNFSNQPFSGSLGDKPPATPIVAITALT
ncbi:MAG: hypothetical protein QOE80_2259 [Actinomycetota bacterium]|jgi:hypothetical protein|nr:hypothetical protein [Actinomycetota bacterium]